MSSTHQSRPHKRRRLDDATPWPTSQYLDARGNIATVGNRDHEIPATVSPQEVILGGNMPPHPNFVIADAFESSTDSDEPDHFYHDVDFGRRPRPPRRSTADRPILISDDPDIEVPDAPRIARRNSTSRETPVVIPDDDDEEEAEDDDDDVIELPCLPVREGEEKIANSQCAICMDDWKEVTVTKCGHVFCYECIKEALRMSRGNKPRCPFCRTTFTNPVTVVQGTNSKKKPQIVPMMFKLKRR